ncbi:DUF5996 family protein [Salinifilum aidingensis]
MGPAARRAPGDGPVPLAVPRQDQPGALLPGCRGPRRHPVPRTDRTAEDPDGTLLEFLQSTCGAAADNAGWERASLEDGPEHRVARR